MREPQKTILEKTKPIFPAVTQPIISAASHPERSGVTYTHRFRKLAGMPRVIDSERRRLSHAHKVRFHEYGDGYVLSVTVQDADPADLAALLKGLQSGYIKVTLER